MHILGQRGLYNEKRLGVGPDGIHISLPGFIDPTTKFSKGEEGTTHVLEQSGQLDGGASPTS